ncbi:phosphatase [Acidaminobacter sp. JC074]|uniref:phosphatase n=1 Tax=Acidaminobacter sp. JC074 TaxID=2530199 RepID=UPI001F0FD179|nr:phosphatase [Acidaminobacter sp. JC074]MCH4889789.1 phosphatase [Acidaminobacter sp. JC074]
MNIIDLHTHTVSSGHAYSTLEENVKGALRKGIQILGMSDHAGSLPGAPHVFHFHNLKIIPEYIEGVRVLKGIEANIIDYKGTIDVEDELLDKLDYVIASLHPPVITPGNLEENTDTLIKTIQIPQVKIIGHPDDGRYPIDYERVVKAAKAHDTLLEINNASLTPSGTRQGTVENSRRILELCKEHQVSVILGSDSHISYSIGDFDKCLSLIKEVDFPKELIVNNDIHKLKKYLKKDLDF